MKDNMKNRGNMKVTTNITIIAQGVEITITLEEAKQLKAELDNIFPDQAPIYPWYPPVSPNPISPNPLDPGPWTSPNTGDRILYGSYTT